MWYVSVVVLGCLFFGFSVVFGWCYCGEYAESCILIHNIFIF
jgi:Na+/alanine symporter